MGFFEKAGRTVEKFKQSAEDAAEEHRSEECPECGETWPAEATECPECGAVRSEN